MDFSPKFLVLGAVLVSLVLAVALLSAPGAQADAGSTAGKTVTDAPAPLAAQAAAVKGQRNSGVLGSATLSLNLLAKSHNLDEADNVRWSLARGTASGDNLYNVQSGVNWAALRKVSASGSIHLAAGASWSFNATYGGGAGYKNASGVLAGGQCSLATVFRAAALKAGLVTKARPHRTPIPGFPQNETVNIWWGSYDLVIQNTSGQDLSMDWALTPTAVTVTIYAPR